jgi:hypothetical protein
MAWFEWGLDTTYGNSTPAVNIGSGSSPIPMSAALTGLRQDVFYHFRVVRNDGTATTFGWDSVFGTSPGTLTVTSLADSGSGTLRDLLTIAVPGDTITFAPGLTGSIMLGQSLPTVNKAVTIIGPGAASVALSGSGLNISNGVTASVSGLTITNVLVDERLQVLLVHIARGDHLAFWQGEE